MASAPQGLSRHRKGAAATHRNELRVSRRSTTYHFSNKIASNFSLRLNLDLMPCTSALPKWRAFFAHPQSPKPPMPNTLRRIGHWKVQQKTRAGKGSVSKTRLHQHLAFRCRSLLCRIQDTERIRFKPNLAFNLCIRKPSSIITKEVHHERSKTPTMPTRHTNSISMGPQKPE